MNGMAEFFAMDGYGVYIWASYGLCLAGVVGLIVLTVSRRRHAAARLARLEALEAEGAGQAPVKRMDAPP